MVGTGFLVFVLLGGGVTAALWLVSMARRGAVGSGETGTLPGSPVPQLPDEGPAARAVIPTPARSQRPARNENRAERRAEPRPGVRPEARAEVVRPVDPVSAEEAAAAREAERRRARERRWSLPSDSTGGVPPLPPPAPTPAPSTETPVAPPAVGEILTSPAEETSPPGPRQPSGGERPGEEPATEPRPVPPVEAQPVSPPPREDPPVGAPRPTEPTPP